MSLSTMEQIEIGEIYREHGVKGAVKVYLYGKSDENFLEGSEVIIQNSQGEKIKAKVLKISPFQKWFLTQFSVFTDLDQAKQWRKAKIYVERKKLHALETDELYLFELVGFEIIDQEGRDVGELKGMQGDGQSALFVVEGKKGEILIPAVPNWILKVDKNKKRILMDLPAGLLS